MKDDLTPGIISESNALAPRVEALQREAEARNAAKRQADRQAKMDAWQDPEAILYRKALHEKGAVESLWFLRSSGECAPDRDIPIPPDSELPVHMRGQQPSTVRAFLRGSSAWNDKINEQAKADHERAKIRQRYPELFGIDFTRMRIDKAVTIGEEHKVRDGSKPRIRAGGEYGKAQPTPEPKKGAVARFFAGIKDAFEAK